MQPSRELKDEIKQLIIDTLKIPGVAINEISDSASLFEKGNALELDSVDSLEIVMALQKKYGVHIDDKNQGRFIIKSIDTIAEFVYTELNAGKDTA